MHSKLRTSTGARGAGIMVPGPYVGSAIRAAILLIIAVGILGGCRDVATIWSAQARSPDGLWLARAYTEQHGGPGTAGVETIVDLERISVSNAPKVVLTLLHDPSLASQSGETINLQMKWPTQKLLEVTYNGHADLGLKVVKYEGIDISVRDVSGGTNNTAH